MTTLMICDKCGRPILGEWVFTPTGQVHGAKSECVPLSPFEIAAAEIGKLLVEKNAAYGSSYSKSGEFLKLLYPSGIQPEQYSDVLMLVRIFDKQMRIATAKDALGESPYRDIAGYGILGDVKDRPVAKVLGVEKQKENV